MLMIMLVDAIFFSNFSNFNADVIMRWSKHNLWAYGYNRREILARRNERVKKEREEKEGEKERERERERERAE